MASSNGKSKLFRWALKDFNTQWNNNRNKDIISDSFNIGSASFALFYHNSNTLFYENTYGVILQDFFGKQSVEVSLKLWFENSRSEKFYEHSIDKFLFKKVEDRCKFNVQTTGNDWGLFYVIANHYNKTLYICCELTNLDYQATVSITGYTQFYQNAWLAYEQELHDAIIKIGDTKFKILKTFFMVQSEVFKQMFTLNFKEAKTNIVEIKDVSEQTMEQLIKWVYTCQVDDQGSIEDLFEAADKYQINLLKARCAELMISSLDILNVFRRLILAIAHNDNYLKDCALKYIDKMLNMEMVAYLTSSEWIELAHKKPIFAKEVNKLICDKLKK